MHSKFHSNYKKLPSQQAYMFVHGWLKLFSISLHVMHNMHIGYIFHFQFDSYEAHNPQSWSRWDLGGHRINASMQLLFFFRVYTMQQTTFYSLWVGYVSWQFCQPSATSYLYYMAILSITDLLRICHSNRKQFYPKASQ